MHLVRLATTRSTIAGWLAIAALLLAMWPAASPAQDATPAAVAPSSAMQELFGLVPAQVPGVEDPTQATISWVDIARQLDAVGVEAPDSYDDPAMADWIAATRSLATPSDPTAYLKFWREDYGFDLLQVDQAIEFAAPPARLLLFKGTFDPEDVLAALDEVGYQPITVNGHELLSIRDDYEIDADAPTTYLMAHMNFGVVLPDGTLAFSSAGAPLAAVLDVAAGAAPSMLEQAGIAMLIGQAPPDLVSAVIVHGFMLQMSIPSSITDVIGTPDADFDAVATAAASEIATASEMPPVAMALLGSTAGGPLFGDGVETPAEAPEARAVAIVAMHDPASAEAAVPVVETRLEQGASQETEQPYAEMFASWTVEAVPGTPMLTIDLEIAENAPPNRLIQMLYARDLGFLAW